MRFLNMNIKIKQISNFVYNYSKTRSMVSISSKPIIIIFTSKTSTSLWQFRLFSTLLYTFICPIYRIYENHLHIQFISFYHILFLFPLYFYIFRQKKPHSCHQLCGKSFVFYHPRLLTISITSTKYL